MSEIDNTAVAGMGGRNLFITFHVHNLDEKKRLTIPTDWREFVGDPKRIYIIQGVDGPFLRAVPARVVAKRFEALSEVSMLDGYAMEQLRTLVEYGDLVSWDAQGRIRLRDALMEYAGITNKVVLVGMMSAFELWSPDKWEERRSKQRSSLADAAKFIGL